MLSVRRVSAVISVLCIVILCLALLVETSLVNSPRLEYTIVIDAGHGGRDGGCVGVSGSVEKAVNLDYALELKRMLIDVGVHVVMTRTSDQALYSTFSKNKKLDDMRKRVSLIERARPDLYLSIHMNSTPYTYRQGAQVYYGLVNDTGKDFANILASSYSKLLPSASNFAKAGDLYILDKCKYTGVLVECGFLSNSDEEQLLLTKEYRQRWAYATTCAIILYLGIQTI